MAQADALAFIRAMRPAEVIDTSDIRPATRAPQIPTSNGGVDITDIPLSPADPRWKERFQAPEDWDPGKTQTVAEPVAAAQPQSVGKRIGVYCGRGEGSFVLAVEEAPDWDSETSMKMDVRTALAVVKVVRALGIKVSDKTGGELAIAGLEDGEASTPLRGDHQEAASGARTSKRRSRQV